MRIVSIDGGGIKGYLPALILAALESNSGRLIGSMADMLAGTSTGAILALGLAAGIPASRMAEFYKAKGPAIFRKPWTKRLCSLCGLADEQYDNAGLREALIEIFGDRRLSALDTPCVAVAYDIEARQTVVFSTMAARRDRGQDFTLVDVAMASAAAPTYFEPIPIMSQGGDRLACVDGGVAANNPALCAIVEAIKAGTSLDAISVVSLGTGREERPYLLSKARGWGLIDWARPLLDILFGAASEVTDHHSRHLLGDLYVRLQADFTEAVAMDATDERAFAAMLMCAVRMRGEAEFLAALKLLQVEA